VVKDGEDLHGLKLDELEKVSLNFLRRANRDVAPLRRQPNQVKSELHRRNRFEIQHRQCYGDHQKLYYGSQGNEREWVYRKRSKSTNE